MAIPDLRRLSKHRDSKLAARTAPTPTYSGRKPSKSGIEEKQHEEVTQALVHKVPNKYHNDTTYHDCKGEIIGCATSNACMSKVDIVGTSIAISSNNNTIMQRAPDDAPIQAETTLQQSSHQINTTSKASLPTTSAIQSITESALESSPTTSAGIAGPAAKLECPAANGTLLDDASITYSIFCGIDDGAASYRTLQVGSDGYASCLTACSTNLSCSGFIYEDKPGSCSFKASMSNSSWTPTLSNHTIFVKQGTSSASSSHSSTMLSRGAIIAIGISVASVIVCVMLTLAYELWKRKRNTLANARRLSRSIPGVPSLDEDSILPTRRPDRDMSYDTPMYGNVYNIAAPTYQRNVAYQPGRQHTRQRSIYKDDGGHN